MWNLLARVGNKMGGWVARDLAAQEEGGSVEAARDGLRELANWTSVVLTLLTLGNVATGDSVAIRGALLLVWYASHAVSAAFRRAGRLEGAAAALACGGWAIVSAIQWQSGGLVSPIAAGQTLVVLLAGLIGGGRLAVWMCAMSILNCAAMWAAITAGAFPEATLAQGATGMLVQHAGILMMALLGVWVALKRTKQAMSSARKERERALEAVESLKALFVKSPAPMGITEARGSQGMRRAMAVNDAFERLFQVSEESRAELLADKAPLWRDLAELIEMRAALGTDGLERFKARMRTWDGAAPLVCLVSAKAVQWEGVDSVLWTFQDVTENENLREELEALNAELEGRVQDKAHELAMARKELERRERLAMLGEMVAGVAHEINTPIGNALLSISTLGEPARRLMAMSEGASLSRGDLAKAAKRMREGAEMAMDNLERASEIIKNFKQLSADQAGRARREFDPGEVAFGALRAMASALKAQGVAWAVSVAPAARQAKVDGYPGALSQIVTVLAANALAHGFAPGQADDAGREFQVSVDLAQAEGWISLSFSDNGTGVPEEIAAKIFEPFFTTKAGSGGTGLGLAIAWNVAREALGGELRLRRHPGPGSIFELRMPRSSPEAERQPREAP